MGAGRERGRPRGRLRAGQGPQRAVQGARASTCRRPGTVFATRTIVVSLLVGIARDARRRPRAGVARDARRARSRRCATRPAPRAGCACRRASCGPPSAPSGARCRPRAGPRPCWPGATPCVRRAARPSPRSALTIGVALVAAVTIIAAGPEGLDQGLAREARLRHATCSRGDDGWSPVDGDAARKVAAVPGRAHRVDDPPGRRARLRRRPRASTPSTRRRSARSSTSSGSRARAPRSPALGRRRRDRRRRAGPRSTTSASASRFTVITAGRQAPDADGRAASRTRRSSTRWAWARSRSARRPTRRAASAGARTT